MFPFKWPASSAQLESLDMIIMIHVVEHPGKLLACVILGCSGYWEVRPTVIPARSSVVPSNSSTVQQSLGKSPSLLMNSSGSPCSYNVMAVMPSWYLCTTSLSSHCFFDSSAIHQTCELCLMWSSEQWSKSCWSLVVGYSLFRLFIYLVYCCLLSDVIV